MPVELWSLAKLKTEIKGLPAIPSGGLIRALWKVYQALSIYEQFDALCRLYDKCGEIIDKYPHPKSNMIQLKEITLYFIITIVDATTESDLAAKRKLREQYKLIDPEFMPWHLPTARAPLEPLNLISLRHSPRQSYLVKTFQKMANNLCTKRYAFVNQESLSKDREQKIKCLTYHEREAFRVLPARGKLKVLRKIAPPNDHSTLQFENFSTLKLTAHQLENKAIFVISPKGEIFAGSSVVGYFHHSSFLARKATIFAGSFCVEEGVIRNLSDHSGHYRPSLPNHVQMLTFFRQAKLLHKSIELRLYNMEEDEFELKPIKEYKTTILSNSSHKKILASIEQYKAHQRSFVRYFSNSALSLEKSTLMDNLTQELERKAPFSDRELIELLHQYNQANQSTEAKSNKKYYLGKTSHFFRCLKNIEHIVTEQAQQESHAVFYKKIRKI